VGSAALDTLLACDVAHVRPRIIVVEADMCEPQDRASIRSFLQRDGYTYTPHALHAQGPARSCGSACTLIVKILKLEPCPTLCRHLLFVCIYNTCVCVSVLLIHFVVHLVKPAMLSAITCVPPGTNWSRCLRRRSSSPARTDLILGHKPGKDDSLEPWAATIRQPSTRSTCAWSKALAHI
jgi:hypothetical protein